jgi:hypothetical protein
MGVWVVFVFVCVCVCVCVRGREGEPRMPSGVPGVGVWGGASTMMSRWSGTHLPFARTRPPSVSVSRIRCAHPTSIPCPIPRVPCADHPKPCTGRKVHPERGLCRCVGVLFFVLASTPTHLSPHAVLHRHARANTRTRFPELATMFKTLVLSAMLGVAAAAGEYVGKGGAVSESLESAAVARGSRARAR